MVTFMVLSLFILLGWIFLQNRIWPPKIKEPEKKELKDAETPPLVWKKQGWMGLSANVVAFPFASDPFTASWQTVANLELLYSAPQPKLTEPPKLSPEQIVQLRKGIAITLSATTSSALPQFANPGYILAMLDNPTRPVEPPTENVTIGGEDFFLEAKLTTKGAGIEALWLNQFQAANYLGQPVPGKKLELIQEDPIRPSFVMFHYPDPEVKPTDPVKDAKPPLTTLGDSQWKFDGKITRDNGTQEVKFSTVLSDAHYLNVSITKTYRLDPKAYHLTLIVEIETKEPKQKNFRYQLTGSHGMPLEGEWYTATTRDALIALVNPRGDVYRERQDAPSISLGEGGQAVPEGARGDQFLQYAGVALQYFASVIVIDPNVNKDVLAWARPTKESTEIAGRIVSIDGNTLRLLDQTGKEIPYRMLPRVMQQLEDKKLKEGAKAVVSYYEVPQADPKKNFKVATWIRMGNTPRSTFDDIMVRVTTVPVELMPGKKQTQQFMLYHGPVKTRLLGEFSGAKAVPPEFVTRYTDELKLYTLTDYHSDNWFGRRSNSIGFTSLLIFVTNLMHTLLHWLSFLGGYGIAIVLLTVMVRGAMFPISRKQAMFSIRMQELGPELKKIQEKYKADPRAKTEATMEFYRKHKINPFASCLPLILQMPIFLSLYFALQESIHFRLARFLWVDNLAAPDMLIYWGQSIPWIADPDNIGGMFYLGPFFNLLPLVAVSLMVVQQKMMAPPAMDEQQAMQMKVMRYMMLFMAVLFYKVAAGLAIYFIASSLWGVAERKLLPKKKTDPILAGAGGPRIAHTGKGGPNAKNKAPVKDETGKVARLKKWWQDVLDQAKKK